jgi:hypothetical protein
VLDPDAGDPFKTKGLCRFDPGMAGDDFGIRVDQGGTDEAEARHARRQLLDLSRRMGTGVVRIGPQAVGVEFLDPKFRTVPGW